MPDKLENRRVPYFGDFVLFDEIGRGGMGVVYSAQQTKLDRPVALKVLHSSFGASGGGVERLRIEAEATARLDHPNIVPIYETGVHDGQPYLAMQLVEGESLAEQIAQCGARADEREVVRLLLKVARAVQHAHERGVLHRDLKPGNVLVDERGEPHLIDFGLAKCLEQDHGLTQTGAFMGTPCYASPEQAAGKNKSVTTATDIYSLGAILFAMLTGQPPFAGESTAATIANVIQAVPPRPRNLRLQLSSDLETICLKCLEKEPARRYPSATLLAEELERFLSGEPILARPVSRTRGAWMWARRKPAHAALLVAGCVIMGVSLGLVVVWLQGLDALNQTLRFRQSLQTIQATRLMRRTQSWSDQARRIASDTAKLSIAARSSELTDAACTILEGLDARRIDSITNYGATSVAWKADGTRLLIACRTNDIQIWDEGSNFVQTLKQRKPLGMTFAEGDAACRLDVDNEEHFLLLKDIESGQVVRKWSAPPGSEFQWPPKRVELSAHGYSGVAVFSNSIGTEVLTYCSDGKIFTLESLTNAATALAVSPEGDLVVCGDSAGVVHAWEAGGRKRLPDFKAGRNTILSLAVRRAARTDEDDSTQTDGVWLLAVGHQGGMVNLWDLESRSMLRPVLGGTFAVTALAFSPDAMTLASGGVGPVKIWDVATGRSLLDIVAFGSGDTVTELAFSRDGLRLAMSSVEGNQHPGHAEVWQLDPGRGITTLRGFAGPISKVCFSPNGKRIAALSHDWEIGVWELNPPKLLRLILTPGGRTADNAALAFSPDGKCLAFSAGQHARLWDVDSGKILRKWPLPLGITDMFSFPASGELLLCRYEQAPANRPTAERGSWVLSLRNLLAADGRHMLATNSEFEGGLRVGVTVLQGRAFVVDGFMGSGTNRAAVIKCFDGLTGSELWSIPSMRDRRSSGLITDASGLLVACFTNNSSDVILVEARSGKVVVALNFAPMAFRRSPDLFACDPGAKFGFSLTDGKTATPIVSLGIDSAPPQFVQFSPDENYLAWGTENGSVLVCDLKELRRRLAPFSLAW